jgi:hypothetical protein
MENVFETQQCDEVYMPTQEDLLELEAFIESTAIYNEAFFHQFESDMGISDLAA